MRLRIRANDPEQTAPDHPVARGPAPGQPIPGQPLASAPQQPVASAPQQPLASAPQQPAASAPQQPAPGLVPAAMAQVPQDPMADPAQQPVPVTEPVADEQAVSAAPTTAPPAEPAPVVSPPQPHVIRRTRISGIWVGLGLSAFVLLLLLVFILENEQKADISYFGQHGHLPLGVALLLAALAGALLILIPGSARIIQLRKTARRHRKQDVQRAAAQQPTPPAP
jgi:lipopolysaccharide assembly protein A